MSAYGQTHRFETARAPGTVDLCRTQVLIIFNCTCLMPNPKRTPSVTENDLFCELQCSIISNDLEWFFDDFNVGTLNYITSDHIRPSETADSCTPATTTHPVPVSFEFNAARLDDIDGRFCHNNALKRKESGISEGNDDILLMAKNK